MRENPGVAIELNHTIVPARQGEASARWFADLFGMPEPVQFGHFWQVSTDNGVDLDFDTYGDDGTFTLQHYAFLVSEDEFDAILGRVQERAMDHWADPGRRLAGEINHRDGGRGVYFPSNDDHLLEIITRPYGG
ncbi:MAG TPA: VOC family protein [Acidimicrobiales bacterium]|nr:VOC family protein [Acidimicrobiales bacterium]